MARPALFTPVNLGMRTDEATSDGAGLSHREWLASLKRQHIVRVRTHTGDTMPPAMVTNETPCYVFIGKLKFRRSNGWQVARNAARCYRMRLRLVRNEKEFT